jgi:hypothetical protein
MNLYPASITKTGIFVASGDRISCVTCKVVRGDDGYEAWEVDPDDCYGLLPGDPVGFCSRTKRWVRLTDDKRLPQSPHRRLIGEDLRFTKKRYSGALLKFDFPLPVIEHIVEYLSCYYLPQYGDKVTLAVQNERELNCYANIIPHTVRADDISQYIGKHGIVQCAYSDGAAVVMFENRARILIPALTLVPYTGRVVIKKKKKKKKKKILPKKKCVFYRDANGKMRFDTVVIRPKPKRMEKKRSG